MRRPLVAALGVIAVGFVGLVLAATLHQSTRAFTLGVPAYMPVAAVGPGQTVCQRPVDVPAGAAFDRLTARIGTFHRAGSRVAVTVRDLRGRVVAAGRVPGGYRDIGQEPVHEITLDRTVTTPRIAVCFRNAGPRRVAFYGATDLAARSSSAYLDGRPLRADVDVEFGHAPRSIASLVPRILQRAALFRIAGMGAWAYVVLAALLVVAAPVLLLRALAAAHPEVTPPGGPRSRRRPRL